MSINLEPFGDYISVKDINDENFQDYKKASMFIATTKCDFKCLKELNLPLEICQNSKVALMPNKKILTSKIFEKYVLNPLTNAIVVGGLEPMLQFDEILCLIKYFREHGCHDDFVIYTGYYEHEIKKQVQILEKFDNIIIKYGRFVPDSKPIFDNVLGIVLNSDNQYAVKIS